MDLLAKAFDERNPPAHPALVPSEKQGDLGLFEAVVAVQRTNHHGLLQFADGSSFGVQLDDGCLESVNTHIEDAGLEGSKSKSFGRPKPFESVNELEALLVLGAPHHDQADPG